MPEGRESSSDKKLHWHSAKVAVLWVTGAVVGARAADVGKGRNDAVSPLKLCGHAVCL